ncbi:flagellar basal body-associated FliL family protein [Aromatoleum diolicum]|uniref:Flagellar protein FliL n=1 Tax=Aromatoleum diolicum TaxID=75796 RepID=A0ABX1QGW7_9RHOO|nr:flagellar basal body-associated FliL family protein [Aromatoleum diolicum]NMG76409.1 flagellar basal body protein FliL [Aromatoleum diolicum]
MAKAPPAPAAQEQAPAPKRSKKLIIIIMAAVLVVLLLIAAVVGVLLLKKGSGTEDDQAGKAPATAVVDLNKPPTFVALEPFVVNLAPAEGERFLQVVLALRVVDARTGESLKGFMPEIRHQINLILSSKLPSELATTEGREDLADEIVERTNRVLGAPPVARREGTTAAPTGPIQAVLFNSFIVQ